MANFDLVTASIVVLADSNNPRILNPDFLDRNKIVPGGWSPTNTIVTPPFSTVQYAEGFSISIEETKLQFVADTLKLIGWKEILPAIAIRYLEVLPHVVYKSVGLNFTLSSNEPTAELAEKILMERMLKHGEWFNFKGGMTGVVLDLQYRASQPFLSVKLGAREIVQGEKRNLRGYFIVANYHHDFSPEQTDTRAQYIRHVGTKYNELLLLLQQMPLGS